jgi:hypothetical protein
MPFRLATLVLMAWTNVYCCCTSPAAAIGTPADHAKHACCADKPSAPAAPQHRMPDGRKCDQCPYLAIRQTTLLDDVQPAVPSLDLIAWNPAREPLAFSLIVPVNASDRWTEPIPISATLLDLSTSLVR